MTKVREKAAHFVTLSVANGSEPAGTKETSSSQSASSLVDRRLPQGLETINTGLLFSSSTLIGIADCLEWRGFISFLHTSDLAPKRYSMEVAMALARSRKAPKGHCVPSHHNEAARLPLVFLHLSASLLSMQYVAMHLARVAASNINTPMNCYMGKGGNASAPLCYSQNTLED